MQKFLPFFLALLLFSCKNKEGGPPAKKRISVEVVPIYGKKLNYGISATGELLPWESVEIKSPVQGNVIEIAFREGNYVSKGDLLVKIDDRVWKARVEGLKAQASSLQGELERQEELLKIEGVSKEALEKTEASLSSLQSQIEELNVMIDLAEIRAPFSGKLGMRNFSPGAWLSQGSTITHLVSTNPIKVDFSIPARYYAYLKIGSAVKVVSTPSTDTLTAVVYAIDPVINTSSRNIHARARIENKENKIIPGNFAEVFFTVNENEEALLVPAESVISELNAEIVYTVEKGIVSRKEIQTGIRTPAEIQVITGLKAGEKVVTTGLMDISDGDSVVINEK